MRQASHGIILRRIGQPGRWFGKGASIITRKHVEVAADTTRTLLSGSGSLRRKIRGLLRMGIPHDLVVIVAAYLVLATAYSIATPILEASDENWHMAVVQSIASGSGLPVLTERDKGHILVPAQEAGQPSLFYLLSAALVSRTNMPPLTSAVMTNPFADIGHPDRSNWNKNLIVHGQDETFPWRGVSLAVHLVRLLSLTFGVVTVISTYFLARWTFPAQPPVATLATALVAFNPMLLFISASVDNDALAFAITTTVIAILVHLLRTGGGRRAAAVVGTLVGLGLLTKLSAAAVGVPAGFVFLWLAFKRRSRRWALECLLLLLVPVILLAGWWLARNIYLYGDPIGLQRFLDVAGRRPQSPGVHQLLSESRGVWIAFWGVFGIFDILLPPAYYTAADALAIIAVAGLALHAGQSLLASVTHRQTRSRNGPAGFDSSRSVIPFGDASKSPGRGQARAAPDIQRLNPALVLTVAWLVLEIVLLIRWTSLTMASSGRLLFPSIGSIALLLATGILAFARRWSQVVARCMAVVLAGAALLALPLSILPAYAAPRVVLEPEVVLARTTNYRYGSMELLGATVTPGPVHPGDVITVSLAWRITAPTRVDDAVSVQLRGPDGSMISQNDALPGGGKILTSRWTPDPSGLVLVDAVPIRVPENNGPFLGYIRVKVYPVGAADRPVAAVDAADHTLTEPEVGRIEIRGSDHVEQVPTPLPITLNARFGDALLLTGAMLPGTATRGQPIKVTLQWKAIVQPKTDYTIFLHVVDASGALVFQRDSRPHEGGLPTTDWVAGETVADTMDTVVPPTVQPGTYHIRVGLYDLKTGDRLPLTNGETFVEVGTITVQPTPA